MILERFRPTTHVWGVRPATNTTDVPRSPSYLLDSNPGYMPVFAHRQEFVSFNSGYDLLAYQLETGYLDGQYSLALALAINMVESLGLSDSQTFTQDMLISMAESLGLTDSQGLVVEIPIVMGETLGIDDAQTQQYTLILDLADTLGLLDQILINELSQVGYVMNMDTGAVSLYSGIPATSLGYFNGRLYGTDADGVFKMTGADDRGDPIEARIVFRKEDFGASEMKRMLKAYLGVASDGAVLLKTITADGDERVYRADISNDVIREKRIDLGRGVYSRYWQFELMNDGGSDLTLDAVEYFPVMMTRRIG